jgi:hypothetical protein
MELVEILQKRIDKAYKLIKFVKYNTKDRDAKLELDNALHYLCGTYDRLFRESDDAR